LTTPEQKPADRFGRFKSRWQDLCQRPAFWAGLFVLWLLLYLWPFIPADPGWTGLNRYVYLFVVWGLNIVVITIVAITLPPFRQGSGRPK
jgi:hypothetical protein